MATLAPSASSPVSPARGCLNHRVVAERGVDLCLCDRLRAVYPQYVIYQTRRGDNRVDTRQQSINAGVTLDFSDKAGHLG